MEYVVTGTQLSFVPYPIFSSLSFRPSPRTIAKRSSCFSRQMSTSKSKGSMVAVQDLGKCLSPPRCMLLEVLCVVEVQVWPLKGQLNGLPRYGNQREGVLQGLQLKERCNSFCPPTLFFFDRRSSSAYLAL